MLSPLQHGHVSVALTLLLRITANIHVYSAENTGSCAGYAIGILHALMSVISKTAFSYFLGASIAQVHVLSKIMMDHPHDVAALLNHKHAVKSRILLKPLIGPGDSGKEIDSDDPGQEALRMCAPRDGMLIVYDLKRPIRLIRTL
uniref:Uncharacterized protein n=1 Tax=Ditylenchus dipsaci TaxID=166011 RepID=A0A915E9Y5_9BILA